MTDASPMISLQDVRKRHGATPILNGMSFEVGRGESVFIMGPSGSGKTTTLRVINGLSGIDSGRISVDGAPVEAREGKAPDKAILALRRKVGMVFQQFNLFPHRTVLENVAMPLIHLGKRSAADSAQLAGAMLARLGVDERARSYPGELSAGQQQRAALARTLVLEPEILLLDEVTASLDPEAKRLVTGLIGDLAASGVTFVMVSHDISWIREQPGRVLFMDRGVVVESGPARTFFQAARDPRTQSFLSHLAT
jgi:polar amino acid transport system ATP-binding protein